MATVSEDVAPADRSAAIDARVMRVDSTEWSQLAAEVARKRGRLIALWGADRSDVGEGLVVYAAFASLEPLELVPALKGFRGLVCARLPLYGGDSYPDLTPHFAAANRMQRAAFDMTGVRADRAIDERPWLRHEAWPADYFPLRNDALERAPPVSDEPGYRFVQVAGDGVHEIPVGPIHAGIIEPGHFRFSIVGEKVLRLEERLGYVHKGIERRFQQMAANDGYRLAGRVSGDSTVAYAWAYCMALEHAAGCAITPRAAALRALLLERERIANHLGDLGALANDASLAFGLAQFSRLREDWLRVNQHLFGHRLLMDRIVPGGVCIDVDRAGADEMLAHGEAIQREVGALHAIYDEHAGMQDRFMGTGIVTPELATRLGLCGLAARASGHPRDLRVDFPCVPYDRLGVRVAMLPTGDVAARVAVRFDELFESLRLLRLLIAQLPDGATCVDVPVLDKEQFGVGWIEGWRGEVLVALDAGPGQKIRRCHCHDPSWQNWPVLEHAVIGNIVPDFPLINKSFNLSYSGQDL